MNDSGDSAPRSVNIVARTLRDNRWTLAALVVLWGAIGLAFQLPAWAPVAAVLAAFAALAGATARFLRVDPTEAARAAPSRSLDSFSATALAAAIPEPLVVFDSAGTVVFANQVAGTTFAGLSPGLSLPMKFRAPEMREFIAAVIDTETARSCDYTERVPIERVFRVVAGPIGSGSGSQGRGLFAMIFKDQSEARRIDRMRADFIANASHELRTPLASIAGFVETLRGPAKNDAAARERFLKIMQDQTERMSRLIDDLLSLSRLEMKPLQIAGNRVDLRQVVDRVIDSLGPLAQDLKVNVARDFPASAVEVPGNGDELFQVFENLLENACKYGQAGGRVEVSIHAPEGKGREATVIFRDFGPGIAAEHLPRITERFYRADVETSRSQKGTGLGLSIVKHILTRHGGRLAIRSELGKGAEFVAHLPTLPNATVR